MAPMDSKAPDILARPLAEAEALLREAGCSWQTEITRPTRDFFKTDNTCLYVVRVREQADGTIMLTLAAKQRKQNEFRKEAR